MLKRKTTRWQACPECDGRGIVLCGDHPDDLDAILSGVYDAPCRMCRGAGSVTKKQLAAHQRQAVQFVALQG